ncbi:hypothetical protein TNCV_4394041 [Trichonephila clavipes]|uniref:Uncharacterized protein n=1 Tax=Trichonephila clavipes TaxID=2585209 RepID=A0A8X6W4D2_TRICX|nr:hypothetical protein TNCV_4394041 [Trichonephila clavipes]
MYVHHCPTRRVFSGTEIELMTCLPGSDTLTTGPPQPPPCRRSRCILNMSRLKHLPNVVVWKFEEGVPAQSHQ